jgi:hypothetical protein
MATNFTNIGSTFMAWDVAVMQARLNELLTPPTPKPTALDAFSTRFSDVPSPSGIISVPIVTYPTAADNLNSGMVLTGATASVQTLTLNNDIGKFFPFNPAEAQQYGLDNLLRTWLAPAMYACDRTVASASLAIALNASNFSTASVKAPTSSSFNVALTGRLQAELSNAGINGQRFAVLAPTYYWGLVTNIASAGNAAGAAALQAGSPNNPLGISVVEAQDLPALPADTAATSSIVGFVGNSSAVAVGTAIPNVVHNSGQSVVLNSPYTKVPYLVESYYDEVNRRWVIGASVIYAVAKVQNTLKQVASL